MVEEAGSKKQFFIAIFLILIIAGSLFYYFTIVKDGNGKGAGGKNVDEKKISYIEKSATIEGTLKIEKKEAILVVKDEKIQREYSLYYSPSKDRMAVDKTYKEGVDKNGKKTISIDGAGLGGSFVSLAEKQGFKDKDRVEIEGDILGENFIRIHSIKKIK